MGDMSSICQRSNIQYVLVKCPVPVPAPLSFFSSSKRFSRTALLLTIFCLMAFCWLASLHAKKIGNCHYSSGIKYNSARHYVNVMVCLFFTNTLVCSHSLVSDCHCLGVSGRDHEADGWGSDFMSSCILHIPSGPIVPEQSVPLPTWNLPLCTLVVTICHRLLDLKYSMVKE